jgi:hypothetical protein
MSHQGESALRPIKRPWCGDVAFYFLTYRGPGRPVGVGTEVLMEDQEEGVHYPVHPTFSMHVDDVKRMMQELWDQGIRPEGISTSEGEIGAVRAHLKDTQELLNRVLPKALRPK